MAEKLVKTMVVCCNVIFPFDASCTLFKKKQDVRNGNRHHKGVKLFDYAMKVVDRVLEKKTIQELMNADATQFGFMPGKGATYVLFTVRRLQDEYRGKVKNLLMCFVDI